MTFEIHPQLIADCHHLGSLSVCHVLLHKNAILPWFILVPEVGDEDFLDVDPEIRNQIVQEAAWISAFIKTTMRCSKTNVAAIGNVVRQLHVHIVGRNPGDACWPQPVWGNLNTVASYTTKDLAEILHAMQHGDVWGEQFTPC